jgi:hypothetical protein
MLTELFEPFRERLGFRKKNTRGKDIHPPALALQFLKTHSLIFTDDFTPIKIAAPFESDFSPSNSHITSTH